MYIFQSVGRCAGLVALPAIFAVLCPQFEGFETIFPLALEGLLQHVKLLVQFQHLLALPADFSNRV